MKKISIVIPVYNNAESVWETFDRINELHIEKLSLYALEVIFVDDGSRDQSWSKLKEIQETFPATVRVAKLSRNFGQVQAILAGYNLCKGDAIITISADLQDPISLMESLVESWSFGNEIVIAHRSTRSDDLAASLFSRIAYGIARRANPKIPAGGFDYLLMSRRAVEIMKTFSGRHRFFQGDVLWIGLTTAFLPYAREKRQHGSSEWSLSRKFKYFGDLLIDSSYFPIRAMSALGMLTAAAGVLYSIIIVGSWFANDTPFEGWAPLMIIVLMIGGALMTMLGIIGEYIWRMYDDIKMRPLFVYDEICQSELSGHHAEI